MSSTAAAKWWTKTHDVSLTQALYTEKGTLQQNRRFRNDDDWTFAPTPLEDGGTSREDVMI
eukprot:scaffold21320_cov121-Skeletonema_dohrnii-CCMP3373.AAC.1